MTFEDAKTLQFLMINFSVPWFYVIPDCIPLLLGSHKRELWSGRFCIIYIYGCVRRQLDSLSELYEQIHSTSDELLLQQYEDLIKSLVAESREHRMENEQLETSLRR